MILIFSIKSFNNDLIYYTKIIHSRRHWLIEGSKKKVLNNNTIAKESTINLSSSKKPCNHSWIFRIPIQTTNSFSTKRFSKRFKHSLIFKSWLGLHFCFYCIKWMACHDVCCPIQDANFFWIKKKKHLKIRIKLNSNSKQRNEP